jgi:type I restriction enzyme, S subunit
MNTKWPLVRLDEVLTHYQEYIEAPELKMYPKLSVKLYGKGVTLDTPADGASLKMKRHQLATTGQVILSEIWGKKGAIGFVPPEGDGALCTSHFFLFDVHTGKLDPKWLQAIFDANYLQGQLDAEAKGTTGYAAVRPKILLACEIPLPPLAEQRRVVARIEDLATQINEARGLREEIEGDLNVMLASAHRQIAADAPRKTLIEVAPLNRRPAVVELEKSYPTIAVRSFGRGTFHKPPLIGSEITWEKPFLVKAGDILVSNIKAWEGALAVAKPGDDGRFGSHRYLTCVPIKGVATARFVCFYLLTPEGLHAVGEASPGSADRNRTLSAKAFMQILVPVPEYSKQLWFDSLCEEVDKLKDLQVETAAEIDALLPSVLSKAVAGKL